MSGRPGRTRSRVHRFLEHVSAAAKFAAYHRYLASARAAKDFDGPPSILVVTAGPAAENRVVDAVMAAEFGQPRRLPLLLTTVDLLTTAEHGPFDCVWRIPGGPNGRRAWPEMPSGSSNEPRLFE